VTKKIQIFSSFEEQKEAEISYALSISPSQRIKEAVQLIKSIYSAELQRTSLNKKIRIIRKG
jgi:hypothetical protein